MAPPRPRLGPRPRWAPRPPRARAAVRHDLDACKARLDAVPLRHFAVEAEEEAAGGGLALAFKAVPAPAGVESAPRVAVLLLPGYGETMDKYAEVVRDIHAGPEGRHATVYIVDHRGQGLSGREPPVRHDPRLAFVSDYNVYVSDLERFVREVICGKNGPPDRLCLVAHSMGGLIGSLLAARNPGMFSALTLSAPLYQLAADAPIAGTVMRALLHLFLSCGQGHKMVFFRRHPVVDESFQIVDAHRMSHDRLRCEWCKDMQRAIPLTVMTFTYRWLVEVTRAYTELERICQNITCPVEILQAERDTIVQNAAHLRLARKMPNATVICTGHEGFHEQFVETDEIRDQLIAACLRNVGGELARRTPEECPRPAAAPAAGRISGAGVVVCALLAGVVLALWRTGHLTFLEGF